MATRVIDRASFDTLLSILEGEGFTVIGPTIEDQAIVYDEIHSTAEMPEGWTDEQEGGHYRLRQREDGALFGYNLGPTSWKRFLFPPEVELLRIRRNPEDLEFIDSRSPTPRYAFIGVRACELAAMSIQDKVFMGAGTVDQSYASRRAGVFTVAVNCGQAGATCFCTSMETGPRCTSGFDIVATEILNGGRQPSYVVEGGTERGDRIVDMLGGREANATDDEDVDAAVANAERQMGRHMDTDGIRDLLVANPDHPRWEDVADRCLTCGNCTLACPTCFCSTVTDAVTLDGEAIRSRRWDSCFSLEFTGLHGNPVRLSPRSRYRQWMTHKLATWHDQFDSSGCVGCGRCITWCPVGIDITEEVAAIRDTVPA